MRIRALLFAAALAAVVAGIGADSASAVTLFNTTGHGALVSLGMTADATSATPVDITAVFGGVGLNRCFHSSLNLKVADNGQFTERVAITVTSSTFGPGCVGGLGQPTGTHVPPWKLTITGNSTMIGTQTAWAGTVDNAAIDFNAAGRSYTGNLETGVTVTQPTVATSPICFDFRTAGTLLSATTGAVRIDGSYCITGSGLLGPAGWSLTDN
jgi:hypothetical protein